MEDVQAHRAKKKFEIHGGGTVAFKDAEVDAACEQRGEENESFGRGNVAERLVHACAEDGGQMDERHPNQHHAARGIEFGGPLHAFKTLSSFPGVTTLGLGGRLSVARRRIQFNRQIRIIIVTLTFRHKNPQADWWLP